MSDQNKPKDDNAPPSGELTEDQLESVTGGAFAIKTGSGKGFLGRVLGQIGSKIGETPSTQTPQEQAGQGMTPGQQASGGGGDLGNPPS